MSVEVRYHSRGGNTRRLAEAAAAALGVQARDVSDPMAAKADTVFLCASVYAGNPDKAVLDFLSANAGNIGKLVVLSTSASGKSTHARLKAAAQDAGIETSDAFFHCPGAFLFLHKGRPNAQDCANAAAFCKAQLG